MGGYGSGRPGWHDKVEHYRSLDVNRLHRAGCLRPGWWGNWQWTQDGEQVALINLRAEENRLRLEFKVRIGGGDWESVSEAIPITYAPCRYGGTRPYFLCRGVVNGRHCGRRVAKLYAGGRYFLCRHCYRLAYASQSEARHDRLLRRANKRRIMLGGESGTASAFPAKPKGMWWRTYDRHMDEIAKAEAEADRAFLARFAGCLIYDEIMGLNGR
jgi:hypothetical protein